VLTINTISFFSKKKHENNSLNWLEVQDILHLIWGALWCLEPGNVTKSAPTGKLQSIHNLQQEPNHLISFSCRRLVSYPQVGGSLEGTTNSLFD
jgi:hypothetical protein